MRDDYILLVKDYINGKPEYKEELDKIRSDILTRGVTLEEFEEAVRQLAIPSLALDQLTEEEIKHQLEVEKKKFAEREVEILQVALKKEKEKKIPSNSHQMFNPLVELDIITHVAVIGILALLVGAFFLVPQLSQSFLALSQRNQPQAATTIASTTRTQEQQDPLSQFLAPPVYANTQAIDANRVFSFPPSDVTLTITGKPKKEVYGFFPYWMLEKADNINLATITTVSLFGLEVDAKGNIIIAYPDGTADGGWAMWTNSKLDSFIKKMKKQQVKVQVTIKAFNNTNIENLVVSDDGQKRFISNVLHLINTKSLDGINLDFEYVGTPDKSTTDGFTRLVTNLRVQMQRQVPNTQLSICTYIVSGSLNTIFDVSALAQQSDALVIMGYDVHTPGGSAGSIAPMGGGLNIVGLMQSYLEKVDSQKLILAVPYYGYDWPVIHGDATKTLANASTLSYAELADISKKSRINWDDQTQTPWYTYIDPISNITHEVHFENTRSLGIKYDFINKKNLQGVGIWALGYDGYNTDLQQLLIEKFAN